MDLHHLVPPQCVLGQRALDPHLHHLERAAQDAAEQPGVLELAVLLGQLNKLCERPRGALLGLLQRALRLAVPEPRREAGSPGVREAESPLAH